MATAKTALDNANGATDPKKILYDASVVKKVAELATTTDAKKLYDDQKKLFDLTPTSEKNAEVGKVSTALGNITAKFNDWKTLAVAATTKYTAYLT